MALRLLTMAATVVMFASPALAQQGGPLTPEQREARFVAADKNKDGKLDKAEWRAFLPPRMLEQHGSELDRIFDSRDADSDRYISRAEHFAPSPFGGPGQSKTTGNR